MCAMSIPSVSYLSVPFSQFLSLDNEVEQPIDSSIATSSPHQLWQVANRYGRGTIATVPLVGGAGLVVMNTYLDRGIKVFAEQAAQQNLSLTICLQGSLTSCLSDGTEISIGRHETLFARYQETQCGMASKFEAGEDHCFVSLLLSEEWLRGASDDIPIDTLTNPDWQGILNSGPASQMMLATAHEIVELCRQASLSSHLISAKALELWAHQETLLKRLLQQPTCQGLKSKDITAIHQAASILQREMLEPPGLHMLARRVGINDNKLKKGFRQVYGTTAYAFLQQYRLQQAREMISRHDCNVTQAAVAVGFKSTSHFAAVFKRKFGIAPSSL